VTYVNNRGHVQVTQAFYRQCTARVITAVRADLVTKIYSHTLKLSSSSSSRDAASTIMSADVERFAAGSRNMHECWACIIDVALGIWLLEQQLGVAVAATGGLMATFVGLTLAILPPAGKRQNAWLKGMETRIAATTQSLQAMKGVKMTGVASTIRRDLIGLRKAEVRKLRQFRYILLIVAWAAWIPVIMAPILGFTLYSVVFGGTLTPAMVYRCLTIFGLSGNAVAILIDSAIKLVTSVASLLRIQSFLLDDNTRLDSRVLLPSAAPQKDEDEIPLLPLSRMPSSNLIRLNRLSQRFIHAPVALQLTRASAGWNADMPLIVHDANLDVSSSTVLAVVGPIGSGKTTLLQMLLGETRCAAGSVALSSLRIGYCSQTPWLTHQSVRNNIVGSDIFKESWYNAVVRATALDQDIRAMALGDSTVVGNEGSSLSGGQKKRIALARAIYTRAPIVILDDPFNGLDGRTETAILEAVLGRQGLLRKQKTLVVWATSTGERTCMITLRERDNEAKNWSRPAGPGRRPRYFPHRQWQYSEEGFSINSRRSNGRRTGIRVRRRRRKCCRWQPSFIHTRGRPRDRH
jgi:ATP-binding cassette subfamily C (CFTR/MRP) protein 1